MRTVILCVMVALAGCPAHDVHARFPSAPGDATGTLVLLLSQPASDVSVAVNGALVVEDAHTRRISIAGVPVGTAEVIVAANGGDKEFRAWVGGEQPTTVPLGIPDASTGMWKSIFATLVTIVAYRLIH